MSDALYAEDMPYWKTGKSAPESWIEKAERQIEKYGGTVTHQATARQHGRQVIMMRFILDEDEFQVLWPVLESRTGNTVAALRQTATMLYHDVKSRAVRHGIFGARVAFFDYLLLEDGRPAAQLADAEIGDLIQPLLAAGGAS